MNPMNPQEKEQATQSWADASAAATRFREIQLAYSVVAMSYDIPEAEANDWGQVEAWLDRFARNGQLRVTRTTADNGRIARHIVEILDENEDGEVVSIECGGYVEMSELRRGYCGGTDWLTEKEEVSEGWVRITMMITDMFPDHRMFKRADGSSIVLDPYSDDHFHMVKVTIHQDDLRTF